MIAGRLYLDGKIKRMLVVAPSSVCPVWPSEFRKFGAFPARVAVLQGDKSKRLASLRYVQSPAMPGQQEPLRVAVINYESTWRLEDELKAFDADLIVCDESQRIKSHTAQQSKAMHRLGEKARYRMILTGTPIQNDTRDLWSQYKFLAPGVFPSSYCDEKILNDQPILFELGATKTFAGTDFIDSGVKLYDTDKDFTIAVEFTPAEENPTLCKLLFCGYDNYELAGATYRPLAMTRTINGSDKYYIVSAYGVSVSCYINPDIAIQHRLVLTHTAGTNVLRGDYTDDAGAVKNFTITAPGWVSFDRTLLIGCHEWQDEKKGYYWMGTMTDCRILNYALKSSQVQGYLQAGHTALS